MTTMINEVDALWDSSVAATLADFHSRASLRWNPLLLSRAELPICPWTKPSPGCSMSWRFVSLPSEKSTRFAFGSMNRCSTRSSRTCSWLICRPIAGPAWRFPSMIPLRPGFETPGASYDKHREREPFPRFCQGLARERNEILLRDGVARAGNPPILPGRKRGHALRPVEFLTEA